jgi:hypothetical protein
LFNRQTNTSVLGATLTNTTHSANTFNEQQKHLRKLSSSIQNLHQQSNSNTNTNASNTSTQSPNRSMAKCSQIQIQQQQTAKISLTNGNNYAKGYANRSRETSQAKPSKLTPSHQQPLVQAQQQLSTVASSTNKNKKNDNLIEKEDCVTSVTVGECKSVSQLDDNIIDQLSNSSSSQNDACCEKEDFNSNLSEHKENEILTNNNTNINDLIGDENQGNIQNSSNSLTSSSSSSCSLFSNNELQATAAITKSNF